MADQSQCPNCEGYRVTDTISTYNRKTGKTTQPDSSGFAGMIVGIVVISIIGIFVGYPIYVIVTLTQGSFVTNIQSNNSPMIPIGIVWAALLFFTIRGIVDVRRGNTLNKILVKQHNYKCQLCGFTWQWREDQPYETPYVSPSRDPAKLRELGEKRLQEENRMMADWIYLRDQQNRGD